jgi:hypothetical protein
LREGFNTTARPKIRKDKEKAHRLGPMALIIQEIGKMIWQMERGSFTNLMGLNTKAILAKIDSMAMESMSHLIRVSSTKANFMNTSLTAMELRYQRNNIISTSGILETTQNKGSEP